MINFQIIEDRYLEYLDTHSRYMSSCSGVGSCEDCNKKMYPLRTKYLKAYINLYKHNKELCPRLHWASSDTALICNLNDFHTEKCQTAQSINECSCILSDFIRIAYPDYESFTEITSFRDQIYPVFKKMTHS
jgi:hypothetical protein